MKLSHRADYALRAISNLADLPKGKLNTINAIAQTESIPREFLPKLLQDLTAAGILASFRGVTGGYRLTRPPRKVSFLDVIEAVDGPLHLSLCTESTRCSCKRDDHCHMHQFWVAQEKVFRNALSKRHFGTKR